MKRQMAADFAGLGTNTPKISLDTVRTMPPRYQTVRLNCIPAKTWRSEKKNENHRLSVSLSDHEGFTRKYLQESRLQESEVCVWTHVSCSNRLSKCVPHIYMHMCIHVGEKRHMRVFAGAHLLVCAWMSILTHSSARMFVELCVNACKRM